MHRDKPSEFVEAGTNLLTGVHKNEKSSLKRSRAENWTDCGPALLEAELSDMG